MLYDETCQIDDVQNGKINAKIVPLYDLHGDKMVYLLTHSSQWSRYSHPLLVCNCRRGDGVSDSTHSCKHLTYIEQTYLFSSSTQGWDEKGERVCRNI